MLEASLCLSIPHRTVFSYHRLAEQFPSQHICLYGSSFWGSLGLWWCLLFNDLILHVDILACSKAKRAGWLELVPFRFVPGANLVTLRTLVAPPNVTPRAASKWLPRAQLLIGPSATEIFSLKGLWFQDVGFSKSHGMMLQLNSLVCLMEELIF